MNKKQITDLNMIRFFRGCVWDFQTYPDTEIAEYFSHKKTFLLDLSGIAGTALFNDIKDIFVCVFVNGEPYTYKSKAFPSMLSIHEFMTECGYEDFSHINDGKKADEEWQEFWSRKGKKYLHDLQYVISNCIFILNEYRDTRTGLDRNFWRLSDMNINNERLNKSKETTVMNFWKIQNEENRELLKLWFKHLIGGTELAYSTIYERFSLCNMFVEYLGDKSLLNVSHDDIEDYRSKANLAADRNNHLISDLRELYKYLQVKKRFTGDIPINEQDVMANRPKYIKTSVSDYTIGEMFKHLHTLPSSYMLMYLINLFTGIRISDICQLKTDCLYQNEHGYFLAHDCQKMQDAGAIPICKELYDLINERITWANSNQYQYLFPAEKDKTLPYNSGTYRKNMQKYVIQWGIKNPDGTAYHFTTHAYRHTIATTLAKMGMPSALIQIGILHHTEINMSRHYIEDDADSQLREINEKGLNISGNTDTPISPDDAVLPNGFCHMPIKIQCDKISACLNCEYFRTSIRFLEVHERHLEKLNEQIAYFNAMGYMQNLAFAEKEKAALELIIAKLHELKGEGHENNSFITAD